MIKEDIIRFISEFYSNGGLVRGVNNSFITLILKVENLVKLNKFKLISLVGFLNKVLEKLLANMLMKVVHKVISEVQFSFLERRQMLDCILIANEVFEDAKRNRKEVVIFNADFEKVYDSVDWKSLDYMMERMGFNGKWRA